MPCDEGVIDALIGRPYNRTSAPVRAYPRTTIAAPSFNGRTADSGSAYRGSNPWGAAKFHAGFSNIPNFLATLCHHCVTTCRGPRLPTGDGSGQAYDNVVRTFGTTPAEGAGETCGTIDPTW